MNPVDLEELGLASGDLAHMESHYAGLDIIVEADETMRRGVVAMSHGWGKLPGKSSDPRDGACTTCWFAPTCGRGDQRDARHSRQDQGDRASG